MNGKSEKIRIDGCGLRLRRGGRFWMYEGAEVHRSFVLGHTYPDHSQVVVCEVPISDRLRANEDRLMKRGDFLRFGLLNALSTACATAGLESSTTEPRPVAVEAPSPSLAPGKEVDLVVSDVALLDPQTGNLTLHTTVVIDEGRIRAIGNDGHWIPDTTIDGKGAVLLPGLVEAHAHLREADESALEDYLEAGITTLRDMNGRPHVLRWRDEIANHARMGPRLIVASPTVANISSPHQGFPTPKTAEAGREVVDRFVSEGYDFIKIYTFLPTTAFDGIMARASERGVRVAGHAPLGVSLETLLASGLWSLEHETGLAEAVATPASAKLDAKDHRGVFQGVEIDEKRLEEVAQMVARHGVWQVATMVYWENVPPPEIARRAWEDPDVRALGHRSRLQIVKALYEAGAPLAVGSDSDAGEHLSATAIWDEMELMVEAGLPPLHVVKAATAEGARMLGLGDVGQMRVGAEADLVLVRCNPAENIRCIRDPIAVIRRGELVRHDESLQRNRDQGIDGLSH